MIRWLKALPATENIHLILFNNLDCTAALCYTNKKLIHVGPRNMNNGAEAANYVPEEKELRFMKNVTECPRPFRNGTAMGVKFARLRIKASLVLLLLAAIAVPVSTVIGEAVREGTASSGRKDDMPRKPSSQELKRVLDAHADWLKKHPRDYNSQEAQSDRGCANLSGAILRGAALMKARLDGANLSGADLSMTNLTKASLGDANLSQANLSRANLSDADLPDAKMSGAILSQANLSKACLAQADLRNARLYHSNLTNTDLSWADLSASVAPAANLTRASLHGANMTRAFLVGANLTRSDLSAADLTAANLNSANLNEAIFEPEKLPDADQIAYASNLSEMRWIESPQAMVLLRKAFRAVSS